MLRRRSSLLNPMTNELSPMAIQEVKSTIKDFQKIQQMLEENSMIMSSPDTFNEGMYAQPLTANRYINQAHNLMEQASMLLDQAEKMLMKTL